MTKGMIMCICILISLNFISTDEVYDKNSEENRRQTEKDAVSNFFSQLGDLFLDIDQTLAIQTAPKVELEGLMAQLLRPSNEYFSNVQENYRTLQKRLGSFVKESLSPKSTYTDRDLSTVGPPTHWKESEQDLSSTHEPLVKADALEIMGEKKVSSQPAASHDGTFKGECSIEILNNPFLEPEKRKECSKRLKRHIHTNDRSKPMGRKGLESRLKNQIHVPFDSEIDTYPNGFFRRGGDIVESTPKPQGRILGDILYSETSFDRSLRQILKDHGRWLLDNPFLTRWRKASVIDNSVSKEASTTETGVAAESSSDTTEVEPTEAYIPITTVYNTEVPVTEKTYSENRLPLKSAGYYRLTNHDGMIGEEVEMVLNPNLNIETIRIGETGREFKTPDSVGSVIIAFTPDGIPLKLKMDPEIQNPTRFLHMVLQSAGVSLNVPVESSDNLEPVGKEVLKFGAGLLIRPTYYDLSNRDDLKTLLRTLIQSKASGKSKH